MSKIFRPLLIMLLLLFSFSTQGQSIDELRRLISQAQEEIRINTELLSTVRKDQKVTESQLKIIRERIRSRRSIVATLEKQVSLINNNIASKNRDISNLNTQIDELKAEYAKMTRTTYINHKQNNFLLFLFASEDFNDVTRRINFMRRYNQKRVEKATKISSLSENLNTQIKDLDSQRVELNRVKLIRSGELGSLGKDENQFKTSASSLKSREGKLTRKVRDKQTQIAKAQSQIQKLIEEEARKNRSEKRTESEERALVALTGRFDENRGKLPYPVSNGVIIDRYGSHPHPTERELTINNKGVNIAGGSGAVVRSVFEGVVTKIVSIPGLNNCVMVRHGSYITLYANLSTVSVKTGDKITHNQQVGLLSQSSNSDDHFLHFELWHETNNLNPEQWLRR